MPKCSKHHAKCKVTMPKCSKYHAKCKVTMSKCSKYHATWQILVPNCCKYKANGTKKERKPKTWAKKKHPKTNLNHSEPIYIYIYLYIYIYIYVCVCVCVCMYACMYACTYYISKRSPADVCMYVCMYVLHFKEKSSRPLEHTLCCLKRDYNWIPFICEVGGLTVGYVAEVCSYHLRLIDKMP